MSVEKVDEIGGKRGRCEKGPIDIDRHDGVGLLPDPALIVCSMDDYRFRAIIIPREMRDEMGDVGMALKEMDRSEHNLIPLE